ncbi:MAG: chemotaxis protein CheW [Cyclobacteriaceae bacterium]
MQVATKESQTFLMFTLGEETFAFSVSKVREVLELSRITPVPESPPAMEGIVNLRGSILPVVSIRSKFGMEKIEPTRRSRIIVLDIHTEQGSLALGALVDAVTDVAEISLADILPPPDGNDLKKAEYIVGVVRKDEEFILLVDGEKVFSQEETVALSSSLKPSEATSSLASVTLNE